MTEPFDWDEILVTKDADAKQLEVSFVKTDGEGYGSEDPDTTPDNAPCLRWMGAYSTSAWTTPVLREVHKAFLNDSAEDILSASPFTTPYLLHVYDETLTHVNIEWTDAHGTHSRREPVIREPNEPARVEGTLEFYITEAQAQSMAGTNGVYEVGAVSVADVYTECEQQTWAGYYSAGDPCVHNYVQLTLVGDLPVYVSVNGCLLPPPEQDPEPEDGTDLPPQTTPPECEGADCGAYSAFLDGQDGRLAYMISDNPYQPYNGFLRNFGGTESEIKLHPLHSPGQSTSPLGNQFVSACSVPPRICPLQRLKGRFQQAQKTEWSNYGLQAGSGDINDSTKPVGLDFYEEMWLYVHVDKTFELGYSGNIAAFSHAIPVFYAEGWAAPDTGTGSVVPASPLASVGVTLKWDNTSKTISAEIDPNGTEPTTVVVCPESQAAGWWKISHSFSCWQEEYTTDTTASRSLTSSREMYVETPSGTSGKAGHYDVQHFPFYRFTGYNPSEQYSPSFIVNSGGSFNQYGQFFVTAIAWSKGPEAIAWLRNSTTYTPPTYCERLP